MTINDDELWTEKSEVQNYLGMPHLSPISPGLVRLCAP